MLVKLTFYTPKENVENVKLALFDVGAGKLGNYDSCCFDTKGVGQFRPLDGSNPTLGNKGIVEYVQEVKTEMLVKKDLIKNVIETLLKVHPYEEVAYEVSTVYQLETLNQLGD